jgi:hypothetical protein
MREARQSRPEEAGMVPTVVSTLIRRTHEELYWRKRLWQSDLIRRATALDQRIGDFEQAVHQLWLDCFASPTQKPVFKPVIVESTFELLERERLEASRRYVSPMMRGRWR